MARTSLAALLPSVATPNDVDHAGAPSDAEPPAESVRRAPQVLKADRDNNSSPSELGPLYLQMERKEARIRLDQADALGHLTRRLNRARRGGGERITDNTLIRVAIDTLLAQSDRLAGITEAELRQSLSL